MVVVMIGIDPHKASHTAVALAADETRPNDARSVAVAAMRSPDIRPVAAEDHASVMKIWVRRHRELSRTRNRIVCRLHAVLCDLVAGGFPKQISAIQVTAVLDGIEPVDAISEARLELAHELLDDLRRVDQQRRAAKRRLTQIVAASGTTVSEVYGAGPVVTASVLGDVGAINRFPTRDHFAAYNGTAPIEASSGNRTIHRLSRRGNRHLNHAIHMAAVAQISHHGTARRAYYEHKMAAGMEPKSALRALKRKVSDALRPHGRGRQTRRTRRPGRAHGERLCIQRDRITPRTGSSDKPLPDHEQRYDAPPLQAQTRTTETTPPGLLTQRGLDLAHVAADGLLRRPGRTCSPRAEVKLHSQLL